MPTSCTFANAEETTVLFTDNRGDTYTVSVDWPGRFREEENDGGGVIGFLANGGVIAPYVEPEAVIDASKNGTALDTRQRQTAKDEAAALAKSGDYEAAILKLVELHDA